MWRCDPTWARVASFTRFLDDTKTHDSRQDFLWTRDLPDNTHTHTTLKTDTYIAPLAGFECQQARGRRPTPETARPPGRANKDVKTLNLDSICRCVGTSVEDSQSQWRTLPFCGLSIQRIRFV
jgi:hypothetical protein